MENIISSVSSNERLNNVNESAIMQDKADTPDNSAGTAVVPEDTQTGSARDTLIESLQSENAALTARIKSLDEQIAHLIRTGGQIGQPNPDIPADTGQITQPADNPEPVDFSDLAKQIFDR